MGTKSIREPETRSCENSQAAVRTVGFIPSKRPLEVLDRMR